jgi:hypothetical protein
MKSFLFSLLLIASLNCEKFAERGVSGPESNLSGQRNAVVYAPADDSRIEPTEFNGRVGLPNLNRQTPERLHNPIKDTEWPQTVPEDIAAPNAPTVLVFDKNNAPAGLEDFIASNPSVALADSLDNIDVSGNDDREMFEVPSTITVGVDEFPGFNDDVEHLPITTLLKGDRPIDEVTQLEGVDRPNIPGREIAPIDISDMPVQSAIPILPPAVPGQYRLQPGQAKQGLNFSTIAAAPKIIMPFSPIPNVVELNNKREPWNLIQKIEGSGLEGGINDNLVQNDVVIPVAEKILTNDKENRETEMNWPEKIPAAYRRSNKPRIVRVDGDVELRVVDAPAAEELVGHAQ